MITINDINHAIIRGDFTNDQLDSILMAVKYARNQLGQTNKRQLSLNATVKFTSSKTGRNMHGKVVKIARKFITVDCGSDGRWRVPANMLTSIPEMA